MKKKDYELAIYAYDYAGDYMDARTERMKSYNLWADQLFGQGEYDRYIEAISALDESKETAEKIRMAQYAKAKKLIDNESYYEAKALLQSLADYEDSENLMKSCNYMLAKQMYLQGQYQEVVALLKDNQMNGYLEADEMITDCQYKLGLISERTEDFRTAAEFFEACGDFQDSREHWLNCCYQYAVLQAEAGETDEAVQWFVKAREHLDTVRQMENIAESFDQVNKIQEADYTRQMILWIRAENALEDGKYQLAADCYSQITDPDIVKDREKEAYYHYGEELLNSQEYEKAATMFAAAIDYPGATEKYKAARISEGNEALDAHDYKKARQCFTEAEEENRIIMAWIAEAEDKLHSGRYAEARQIYTEIGMDEKNPEVWNLEGEACLAEEKYTEAKSAFKSAGNKTRYEDTVLEEAKAHIAAKEYGPAYELLTEIQDREDAYNILQTEKAFISYRINLGDTIVIGKYEQDNDEENGQEQIEWIVLATDDEYHALVLSRYGLDCQPYNQKKAHVTWQTCTLRAWLNHDFYELAFSKDEQEAILTKEVDNGFSQGNSAWEISGGKNTSDKVFLLSYQETEAYLSDDRERMCIPTDYAIACNAYTKRVENEESQLNCWWWLRSPGSASSRAARVGTSGSRSEDDVKQNNVCIRPVLWLDLTKLDN